MTDPIDIPAIDALLAAITQGEWEVERRFSNGCEVVPRIVCAPNKDRECGWIADMVGAPYLGYETTLPNARFIAAAPQLVKRLRDEVVRLRAEYDEALEVYEEGRQLLRESRDLAESRAKEAVQAEMAALRAKVAAQAATIDEQRESIRALTEKPANLLRPKPGWRMPDSPKRCCGEMMSPVAHIECGEVFRFHECRVCEETDESVAHAWPFEAETAHQRDFTALGYREV